MSSRRRCARHGAPTYERREDTHEAARTRTCTIAPTRHPLGPWSSARRRRRGDIHRRRDPLIRGGSPRMSSSPGTGCSHERDTGHEEDDEEVSARNGGSNGGRERWPFSRNPSGGSEMGSSVGAFSGGELAGMDPSGRAASPAGDVPEPISTQSEVATGEVIAIRSSPAKSPASLRRSLRRSFRPGRSSSRVSTRSTPTNRSTHRTGPPRMSRRVGR